MSKHCVVKKKCGSKYERCKKESLNSNIPQNYCFEKIKVQTSTIANNVTLPGPIVCFFFERFGNRVTINLPGLIVNRPELSTVFYGPIDPKYRPKEELRFRIPQVEPDKVTLHVRVDGFIIWLIDFDPIESPATSITYLVC